MAQAPKFQSFCGTLCSHKVVVLFRGKLFILNQLYHKTRPYLLPLLRNPGYVGLWGQRQPNGSSDRK